jgi:hypothetical protein
MGQRKKTGEGDARFDHHLGDRNNAAAFYLDPDFAAKHPFDALRALAAWHAGGHPVPLEALQDLSTFACKLFDGLAAGTPTQDVVDQFNLDLGLVGASGQSSHLQEMARHAAERFRVGAVLAIKQDEGLGYDAACRKAAERHPNDGAAATFRKAYKSFREKHAPWHAYAGDELIKAYRRTNGTRAGS